MPLLFASFLTILITLVLFCLDKKTRFNNLSPILKQTIIGVCFGLSAVFATEIGSIEVNGAAINVRDAAPVTAGLLFGPWAGILSGLIGAFDRYFIAAPIFGIGVYTQTACAIATLFAGCFSALFNVIVFKKHRPLVIHAFVFILVTEVIHMCLVLATHMDDLYNATAAASDCFIPLLVTNTIVVIICFMSTSYLEQKFKGYKLKDMIRYGDIFLGKDLNFSFQFWLLTILIIAFSVSVVVVSIFFSVNSMYSAEQRFSNELESIKSLITIDAERYSTDKHSMSVEYTNDWTIDGIAYYTAVDSNGNILNKNIGQDYIVNSTNDHPEKTLYRISHGKDVFYVMYTDFEDMRIVLQISENYQMFMSRLTSLLTTFALILIFGIVMLCVFLILRKIVNQNLNKLNDTLEDISHGNYEKKVDVYSHSIFSDLSDNINYTVDSLKEDIEKEATKYDAEFELAHEIQMSSLPSVFPAFPNQPEIDVYAKYRSAREVGGDFYDYYYVDKNKICFVVADVSGKGVPAAMFMMRAKSSLMMFARNTKDPAKTLFEVNNYLCENNIAGMFVTAWVGILDIRNGKLNYASAGHNPPMMFNAKVGKVTELDLSPALVLAAFEGTKYKNYNMTMKKEDVLALFTDGVTEANNPNGKLFGEDRLKDFLTSSANKNMDEICDGMIEKLDEFAQDAEQFDDITFLVVKYKGKQQ